jgi:hypothetical protein
MAMATRRMNKAALAATWPEEETMMLSCTDVSEMWESLIRALLHQRDASWDSKSSDQSFLLLLMPPVSGLDNNNNNNKRGSNKGC